VVCEYPLAWEVRQVLQCGRHPRCEGRSDSACTLLAALRALLWCLWWGAWGARCVVVA